MNIDWNIIKSRTIQILAILLIINGIPEIRNLVPANILSVVDTLLIALAGYFRINPKQALGGFKNRPVV